MNTCYYDSEVLSVDTSTVWNVKCVRKLDLEFIRQNSGPGVQLHQVQNSEVLDVNLK